MEDPPPPGSPKLTVHPVLKPAEWQSVWGQAFSGCQQTGVTAARPAGSMRGHPGEKRERQAARASSAP